jgi:hypothetical protein
MNEAEKRANDEVVAHLTRECDAARALCRRLAHALIEDERSPTAAEADALLAFHAQPWAREGT